MDTGDMQLQEILGDEGWLLDLDYKKSSLELGINKATSWSDINGWMTELTPPLAEQVRKIWLKVLQEARLASLPSATPEDWTIDNEVVAPISITRVSGSGSAQLRLWVKGLEGDGGVAEIQFKRTAAGPKPCGGFRPKGILDVHWPPNQTATKLTMGQVGWSDLTVDALVNGVPALVDVDTGTSPTVFSGTFLARIGLTPDGGVGVKANVSLGGVEWSNVPVDSIEEKHLLKLCHSGVDGIVGQDLLNSVVATFDFQNSVLSFTKREKFVPAEGETLLEGVGRGANLILLPVEMSHLHGRFALDTGAPAPIAIKLPKKETLLAQSPAAWTEQAETWYGFVNTTHLTTNLTVGPFTWPGAPSAIAADSTVDSRPLISIDGILGLNFWRHFRLSLDGGYARMWLKQTMPFETDTHVCTFGMKLRRVGTALFVQFIVDGGPAGRASLQVGDRVESLNGLSSSQVNEYLAPECRTRGERLSVVATRGEKVVTTEIISEYFP